MRAEITLKGDDVDGYDWVIRRPGERTVSGDTSPTPEAALRDLADEFADEARRKDFRRKGSNVKAKKTKLRFFCSCVDWDRGDVSAEGGLSDLVEQEIAVSRGTFLANVDNDDVRALAENLGYAARKQDGLTMAEDWHVAYYKSKLHGELVYFLRWSAIEYVFAPSQGKVE